ncbi:MAG TPA: GlxA family transcriptional regulator [Candidatus Sulfotelmatobacter sp.]|nr:GlxA family transcriptional regulator [Candidatus Sulfotelmatobacter sp.]
MPKRNRRHVVVLAVEDAQLLDVAGPWQVFAGAESLELPTGYALSLVSPKGGMVTTSSGIRIVTEAAAAVRGPIDTLIVAGGPGTRTALMDRALMACLRGWAKRARRTCSVCTGAFLLAEAGLLDGRRAATHWRACRELQERYPDVRVEPDPIFVRDGAIWTSAGVTAGIDLALALVEADLGHDAAMRVARGLVVFLKRPGGQSQFSAPLSAQAAADDGLDALHGWMAEHLDGDLRVERLAGRAGMSPRTFARVYAAKLGTTPAKTVERLRVEAARRALEDGGAPLKLIAHRCGFGDEERMRRAFVRRLGVSPSDYRARFAG